jgi:acetyltransferase-like isoleucine patch superfamily enzyme
VPPQPDTSDARTTGARLPAGAQIEPGRPPRLPDRGLGARLRNRFRLARGKRPLDLDRTGEAVTMGRHSYFKPTIEWQWGDTGHVTIGSFCSIVHDSVMMLGGIHPSEWVSTFPFRVVMGIEERMFTDGMPYSRGDIVIGNDVHIGREARVLSGVDIGDGAVVAAYSVVTKDVRPYAIVGGNPAREIKRRFTDEQVERLLRIRWWEWPDEKIVENVDLLSSERIEEFLDRFDPR